MDVWLITGDGSLADAVAAALAPHPDLHLHPVNTAAGQAGVLLLGADRLGHLPGSAAPTILLAGVLDPATLRVAYRAGAVDCLAVPAELDALPAAIRNAARAGGDGCIYGLYSAKGGSGRTLLCAVLALALQVRMQRSTLLLDLNLQFGGSEALLNLRPERNLSHLLPVVAELAPEQVGRVACLHPSGLQVLCAPADPALAAECGPEAVRQLLAACRRFYDLVILDLPATLDATTLAALAACDRVLYVATPDALAVPPMQRALRHLATTATLAPERLSLVVNRASGAADVQPADLAAITGLPIAGIVRADFRRVQPLLSGDRDLLSPDAAGGPGRDITQLAAALVHRP